MIPETHPLREQATPADIMPTPDRADERDESPVAPAGIEPTERSDIAERSTVNPVTGGAL